MLPNVDSISLCFIIHSLGFKKGKTVIQGNTSFMLLDLPQIVYFSSVFYRWTNGATSLVTSHGH